MFVGVSQLEYARISLETGASTINTYYATGAHLSVASGACCRVLSGPRAVPPAEHASAWLQSVCHRMPLRCGCSVCRSMRVTDAVLRLQAACPTRLASKGQP